VQGTPFGRYRLVELLGRGGMGEVWLAFDTETRRTVALKMLLASGADDPVFEARFRREAEAAAALNDPHVVPIHNFGEIEGRLYVDMRLIKGRDLAVVLDEGPLDPARAVSIVEQVGSALQEAHRIGLVHRDIKPSNILLTEDDFAYLIDFGISRTADDQPLTSTGMTIGTWAYMAPERFTTGATDPRSDVYALACVLYQCLTGYEPFPGNSIEQQFAGHMSLPPPQPSGPGSRVPMGFNDVIAVGMAKNPDHRYQSVRELAAAARRALSPPSATHVWSNQPALNRSRAEQFRRSAGNVSPYVPTPVFNPQAVDSPLPAFPQSPAETPRSSRRYRLPLLAGAVIAVGLLIAALITMSLSSTTARGPLTTSSESSVTSSGTTADTKLGPSGTSDSGAPVEVVYEVTGPGKAITMEYVGDAGLAQFEFNVPLPWQKDVSVARGAAHVSAVASGDAALTCSITVEGVVISTQTASGFASCGKNG